MNVEEFEMADLHDLYVALHMRSSLHECCSTDDCQSLLYQVRGGQVKMRNLLPLHDICMHQLPGLMSGLMTTQCTNLLTISQDFAVNIVIDNIISKIYFIPQHRIFYSLSCTEALPQDCRQEASGYQLQANLCSNNPFGQDIQSHRKRHSRPSIDVHPVRNFLDWTFEDSPPMHYPHCRDA